MRSEKMKLLILLSAGLLATGFQLNFIELFIGQNVLYGYSNTAPTLNVTFDQLRLLYPHLLANSTFHHIYKPGDFVCEESAGLMNIVAAEAWDIMRTLDGFTVLVSPGMCHAVIPFEIPFQPTLSRYCYESEDNVAFKRISWWRFPI